MMWYQSIESSKIDKLLSNNGDDLPLETLLEEEELIDEIKHLNPKLLDYFSKNNTCIS